MLSEFLRQFVTDQRKARFDQVLAQRTRHITVVLENLFHDHNASACLRTCDCFGLQDVYIAESNNEFDANPDIALGSNKWLTLNHFQTPGQVDYGDTRATQKCIATLKERGYRIYATSPLQDSRPVSEIPVDEPTAVIFGSEVSGVSEYAMQEADGLVCVPMYGFTESFNVSVSVALVLQQLTQKMRDADIAWQLLSLIHI